MYLQGITSVRAADCGHEPQLVLTRLWVHEITRVFSDRLTCDEDREVVRNVLWEALRIRMEAQPQELLDPETPLLFGEDTETMRMT